MLRYSAYAAAMVAGLFYVGGASAEPAMTPMSGSNLIEGYKGSVDAGAKGRYKVNAAKGTITGGFKGLKTRKTHQAIFAWVHSTANQKSELLGPVVKLSEKRAAGRFTIKLPDKFKDGNFGDYEILAFSAEKNDLLQKKGGKLEATSLPDKPSGTGKVPSPAFYLFGALPGAKTALHFCGHGKDFFYASDPKKQTCYDCFCRQKYSACIKAGGGKV